MNRYNNWEQLLEYANEDLEKTGYSLLITEDEEGFYNCEIWKDGELVETYAENYYEDELADLVTDALHYVKTEKIKITTAEAVKRMADFLIIHHDETEDSYPYFDYRIYADESLFNGVISSQDEMTDVLYFVLTINKENNERYIQLFISSPDDMCQDFVYLSSLTQDEQDTITHLFGVQVDAQFNVDFWHDSCK